MIQLNKEELYKVQELGKVLQDTTCYTVLQGSGGSAWVDDKENPRSLATVYGDFCFLTGVPCENNIETELMEMLKSCKKTWSIFVPESREWLKEFEQSPMFYRSERYRLKKKTDSFDRQLLQKYVGELPKEFQIEKIDEKWYTKLQEEEWSCDLCSQFETAQEYMQHGLGFLITKEGKAVAGVSSYSYYDKGIELEIDTKEEFRRRGFATVLGARIILECMTKGLYPSWDAANLISVRTAEKLGYEFDCAYPVFSNVKIEQLKPGEEK